MRTKPLTTPRPAHRGRPVAPRRSRAARDSDTAAVARAAMAAIEPVVELLLDLGVTSPEAESLLRSLFVRVLPASVRDG